MTFMYSRANKMPPTTNTKVALNLRIKNPFYKVKIKLNFFLILNFKTKLIHNIKSMLRHLCIFFGCIQCQQAIVSSFSNNVRIITADNKLAFVLLFKTFSFASRPAFCKYVNLKLKFCSFFNFLRLR